MKVRLIILIILQLICKIFGETVQEGITENVEPVTSEGTNVDLFSSTHQLQKLLQKEVQIVQELEEYLALLQKEIETVQSFLEKNYENEDMSISNVKDFETYVSNPINAFGVIKRMSEEEMISFENQDLIKKHQTLVNLTQTDLASTDDFYTACSSLALIQESYSLRTEDISEGKLRFEDKVFESHYKFEFKDKFSISIAAWNRGWMDSSIEWLQKALQDVTDKDDPKLVTKYKKELERAIEIHDLTLDRKGPYSPTYRTFPLPFSAKLRKKKKYKKAKKEKNVLVKQHKTVPFYQFELPENHKLSLKHFRGNFHSMCEGNLINSTIIDYKLKCRLQHHNVPYLKLGPFKMEELNQDPFIVSFKDFLYHEEIETLKSLAADNLKLSRVGLRDNAKKDTDLRTSKQAWIKDRNFTPDIPENIDPNQRKDVHYVNIPHHLLPPNHNNIYNVKQFLLKNSSYIGTILNKRVALATQLSVEPPYSSEDFQVANYGVGGQYGIHSDAFDFTDVFASSDTDVIKHYERNTGNRFGTFMTYLSDVQAGGSTVFPVIGVKSEAIKGSAIFWLNLDHTNIQNNPLTYHGGCPVLVGSKWIFNKWIRANDQAMSQKCDLKYNNKPTETKNMFAEFRNTS